MTWDARELKEMTKSMNDGQKYQSKLTSTEGTIPDELSGNTKSTRDTKENGVVLHLGQTVMSEENTRMSIDVGPGVLGLASLHDVMDNESPKKFL